MYMYQKLTWYILLTVICRLNTFPNKQKVLHLDLQTDININNTVVLRCTGVQSNASWYLWKGGILLIDDGSVNSHFSRDWIKTNHLMNTVYIEFERFSEDLLDVYRCVSETGHPSNILDLNDFFKKERQHAEVICENITVARGARSIQLQCIIKYYGMNCDENIFWENGNTGEKIQSTEGLYQADCKDSGNGTLITSSLKIVKVTDEIIKTDFFMVYVNRQETIKRLAVILIQDSKTNSNNSALLIILGVAVALLVILVAKFNRGSSGNKKHSSDEVQSPDEGFEDDDECADMILEKPIHVTLGIDDGFSDECADEIQEKPIHVTLGIDDGFSDGCEEEIQEKPKRSVNLEK